MQDYFRFDGNEDTIEKVEMTIGELFQLMGADNEVGDKTGDVYPMPGGFYVETPERDLVNINALIKKPKMQLIELEIEDIGLIQVAEKHILQ